MNKLLQANMSRVSLPLLLLALVGMGTAVSGLLVRFKGFDDHAIKPRPVLVEKIVKRSASACAPAFEPTREPAATSGAGMQAQSARCDARGGVLVLSLKPGEVVCLPL